MEREKMNEIESLDMRGLTLDERKEFLIWYESEFLNIKIKSEIEYEIERTRLLNEARINHPEVFSDEVNNVIDEVEFIPNPKINIKISGHASTREPGYAQISGTLNDITEENLEKFISVIKEAKQSIIEKS